MQEVEEEEEFENSQISYESHHSDMKANTQIDEISLFEELQIKPATKKTRITSDSEKISLTSQTFDQGSWEDKNLQADQGINDFERVQESSSGVQAVEDMVTEKSSQQIKMPRTLMKLVLLLLAFFLLFTFCGAVEVNQELLHPCTWMFLTWGLGLSLPQPLVFLSYDGSLM